MTIQSLPPELLRYTFTQYLSVDELITVNRVCKRWQTLSNECVKDSLELLFCEVNAYVQHAFGLRMSKLLDSLTQIALYWTKKQDKDDRRGAGMICRIN